MLCGVLMGAAALCVLWAGRSTSAAASAKAAA